MKKANFLFLFIFSLILVSCDKDPDELTVTMNNAGTLTFNVVDGTTPLKGANINLYYGSTYIILEGTTDDLGNFTTDKLLEGSYMYSISIKRDNNVFYKEEKAVQVVAGSNKVIKSAPFTNSGTISIRLSSIYNNNPLPNFNVALIPFSVNYSTAQAAIAQAHFRLKADDRGVAKFTKVPIGTYYSIVIYGDNNNVYDYFNGDIRAIKGEDVSKIYTLYY